MFHVGQKVVCICDSFEYPPVDAPLLVKGAIYTVKLLFVSPYNDVVCCLLEELPDEGLVWYGYEIDRFRPIVDTKKEVSWTIGAPDDSEVWDNRRKQHDHT